MTKLEIQFSTRCRLDFFVMSKYKNLIPTSNVQIFDCVNVFKNLSEFITPSECFEQFSLKQSCLTVRHICGFGDNWHFVTSRIISAIRSAPSPRQTTKMPAKMLFVLRLKANFAPVSSL